MLVILPLQTEKRKALWESKAVRIKVNCWRQYNDSAGRASQRSFWGFRTSGNWRCDFGWVVAEVSKKSSAFSFKDKAFEQLDCWPLKIKAKGFSQISTTTHRLTDLHMPEQLHPHNRHICILDKPRELSVKWRCYKIIWCLISLVTESYHSHYLIVDTTLLDTGFWLLKRQNIKNQYKQKNANKRNNYLLFVERKIIK